MNRLLKVLGPSLSAAMLLSACGEKKSLSPEDYPVAVATVDSAKVLPGQQVTLQGRESYDPGGKALIFHWSQVTTNPVSVGYSINDSKDAFTVKVTLPDSGSYGFVLVVENEQGLKSSPDTVDVIGNT